MNARVGMPQAVFTQGPTWRHVVTMTAAGSLGLMAVFIVDVLSLLYVSRLGDPNLTAAVGFASQVLFFAISLSVGVTIAIGALVSRALGAGDRARARRLAASGLVHASLISAMFSVVVFILRRPILALLGAHDATLDLASTYLGIIVPATIFLGLGMALTAVLRGAGDARRALYATLGGGIVTAILDPIFIFGLGLGLDGAAIVGVIARMAVPAIGLWGAVSKHDLVARPRLADVVVDLRPFMAIALPAVLTNLAAPVANAYSMRIFAQFGDGTVAAFAIIDRITPVAFCVLFALAGSVGPIMGQNFGARLPQRVRQILTDSVIVAAIYTSVVWILLAMLAPLVVAAFNAVGETARLVTFFCTYGGALWFCLGGLFVSNATFNNLGFPILSTVFNWGRATLGTIPFVTYGARHAGPEGVFVGTIAGAALFGTFALIIAYRVTGGLAKTMTDG